jgi:hypothetical protein
MAGQLTLTGGCLCGAVRYEWRGTEVSASYCHCSDCQKATGGPYTVGVGVDAAGLTLREGKPKGYTKRGDSGKPITREFCPDCGSPLFTRAEVCPGTVWIKAGSLDEPQRIQPTHQTWTQMAVPWAYLDESVPGVTRNGPESRDEIA